MADVNEVLQNQDVNPGDLEGEDRKNLAAALQADDSSDEGTSMAGEEDTEEDAGTEATDEEE